MAHSLCTFASSKRKELKNHRVMNTDNAISSLSALFQSEASYATLVEMISELDLELMDISLA